MQVQGHLKTCGEVSSVRLKAFHFPGLKATGAQKLSRKKKKKPKKTHVAEGIGILEENLFAWKNCDDILICGCLNLFEGAAFEV